MRGAVTPIVPSSHYLIIVVVDRRPLLSAAGQERPNDHEDEGTITDHDHDDDRMITAVPASFFVPSPP